MNNISNNVFNNTQFNNLMNMKTNIPIDDLNTQQLIQTEIDRNIRNKLYNIGVEDNDYQGY